MERNRKLPSRHMNAVLPASRGSIGTWCYEDLRSNVENYTDPDMASRHASVLGNG